MPKINMVHIFPTFACNFSCVHCYVNSSKYRENKSEFYSQSQLKEVLKFVNRENPSVVHIEGGEPLLFKGIFKLISGIKNKNSVAVVSNGSLIDPKVVQKLEKAGLKKIVISLEGSNAKINRILRGDTFSKTMRGIKLLAKSKIETALSSTLHKKNISDMENIIKMGRAVEVSEFRFGVMLVAGRARRVQKIQLNDKDINRIIKKFIFLEKKYAGKAKISLSLPGYYKKKMPKEVDYHFFDCDAGVNQFAIGPKGEVYSCYNLVDSDSSKVADISDLLKNKRIAIKKENCPIHNSGHIYLGAF